MIHAWPATLGTTAEYGPTCLTVSITLSKREPIADSWMNALPGQIAASQTRITNGLACNTYSARYLTSALLGTTAMAATSLVTTVSTKGQVILPKAIRDQLHWDAGTRLVVEHTAEGVLLKPLTTTFSPTRPEDVFACLPYKGKPKSVEQMDAGIAAEAKRRHARGRY